MAQNAITSFPNSSKVRILAIMSVRSGQVWYDANDFRDLILLYFKYLPSRANVYNLLKRYKVHYLVQERTGSHGRREWRITKKGIERVWYLLVKEATLLSRLMEAMQNESLTPADCKELTRRMSDRYWEGIETIYRLLEKSDPERAMQIEDTKNKLRKVDRGALKEYCGMCEV